jgi:hypothetical protein
MVVSTVVSTVVSLVVFDVRSAGPLDGDASRHMVVPTQNRIAIANGDKGD